MPEMLTAIDPQVAQAGQRLMVLGTVLVRLEAAQLESDLQGGNRG
jgi:hypothetical protein